MTGTLETHAYLDELTWGALRRFVQLGNDADIPDTEPVSIRTADGDETIAVALTVTTPH